MQSSQSTQWNEIVSFLKSLHYEEYVDGFKRNGYDLWEIIHEMTIADFKSIGIKPGHAIRIHRQLLLRNTTTPPPTTSSSSISAPSAPKRPPPPSCPPSSAPRTPRHIPSHRSSLNPIPGSQPLPTLPRASGARPRVESTAPQLHSPMAPHRQLRDQFQQNALFAGGIKNKLFETMTRVLNGLQQELIQYNGIFAEPINEMNQRIAALQKMDVHSLQRDGIWDSSSALFEPMMRNVKDIKKFNHSMWAKIKEFHLLAETQIKQSMKQLETQIEIIHQMKTQHTLKQQHMDSLRRHYGSKKTTASPGGQGGHSAVNIPPPLNLDPSTVLHGSVPRPSSSSSTSTSPPSSSSSRPGASVGFPLSRMMYGNGTTRSLKSPVVKRGNVAGAQPLEVMNNPIVSNVKCSNLKTVGQSGDGNANQNSDLHGNHNRNHNGDHRSNHDGNVGNGKVNTMSGGNGLSVDIKQLFSQFIPSQLNQFNPPSISSPSHSASQQQPSPSPLQAQMQRLQPVPQSFTVRDSISPSNSLPAAISNNFPIDWNALKMPTAPTPPSADTQSHITTATTTTTTTTSNTSTGAMNVPATSSGGADGVMMKERIKKQRKKLDSGHSRRDRANRAGDPPSLSMPSLSVVPGDVAAGSGVKRIPYTPGEIEMMQSHDRSKCSVADIIDLKQRMQAKFGVERTEEAIAQKMYRLGVLRATMPRKFQALQSLSDAEKIRVGDDLMNIPKPRGRPRKAATTDDADKMTTLPSTQTEAEKKKYDDMSVSSYYSDDSSSKSDSGLSPGMQIGKRKAITTGAATPSANMVNKLVGPQVMSSGNAFNSSPSSSSSTNATISMTPTDPLGVTSSTHGHPFGEIGSKRTLTTTSLLNQWQSASASSHDTLGRKSPSTNLRRYTPAEVELIRKLTIENPEANAKALFNQFRQRFPEWRDDTESYTKFYQKKWRVGKTEEMQQHRLLESFAAERASRGRKRPLAEDAHSEGGINPPKKTKVDHMRASSLTAPPPQMVSPSDIRSVDRAKNEGEDNSLIPPLPPPPSRTQIMGRGGS